MLPALLAAPPGPAPRTLPAGYAARVTLWRNVEVLLGVFFGVFFWWTVLFGVIGFVLLFQGLARARGQLDALRHGVPVEGTITSIERDKTKHINRVHPWKLSFRFETDEGPVTGSVESWDPMIARRHPGERLWLVHPPSDPSLASPWPPIA